jgi:glutaredoxin
VVYYLSSLSQVAVAGRLPDYLTHPVEYAGLTLLILRAMNEGLSRRIPWRVHFVGVGIAVLYAISDEIHQLHVPRRSASLKDVLSDTLGAVLAVGIAEAVQRTHFRRRGGAPVAVTLYTRKACHLCEEAKEILRRLSQEINLSVSEVDVDTSVELSRRFAEEIPVVMAAGVKVSKLRPDEEAIRRRLVRLKDRSC